MKFNTVLTYIHRILADNAGIPSSKRTVVMICTALMVTGFLGNEFGGYKVDENIFNSIMYIIIGGMGFTGVEKFAPKSSATDTAST
jgi:predicted MFS family arabinose efflux permease